MKTIVECIDRLVAVLDVVGEFRFGDRGNTLYDFPDCVGSVDTFPVKSYLKDGLYSGKYKMPVYKFQVVINHLGFVTQLVGPFKGAESDTTIFRSNAPDMPNGKHLFGDKAYVSVQYVLPPIKENNSRFTPAQREFFNKNLGHYRARVEQSIRMLKVWAVLGTRWRSKDTELLRKSAFIVASLRNMYCAEISAYDPDL
jgi:hypothetical protein